MSGQIIFVIWRESIEALLVIGILSSWLRREAATGAIGARAGRYLWGGIGAGLGVALLFAAMVLGFAEIMSPVLREDMMTAMIFLATGLIVQMVLWMRLHARTLKRDLEWGLSDAARSGHWWTIFVLAAIAVAREGSETVVFLYGMLAGAAGTSILGVLGAIAAGFVIAFATYVLMQFGSRLLPWGRFFRISEVMLLLLGCALFTTGLEKLVGAGILPFHAPLWDMAGILDDSGPVGGVIASLTGYRAAPDWVTLSGWVGYWVFVAAAMALVTLRTRLAVQRAG